MTKLTLFLLLVSLFGARLAHAEDNAPGNVPSPGDGLHAAVSALAAGKPDDAIVALEHLRDDGIDDPAVSFNLGVAYMSRAKIAESPGDLGRAVFSFEEAKELSHDEHMRVECTRIAGEVRSVVAKRRARLGLQTDMEEAPPPSRAFSVLLSEDAWATLAALSALFLFVGLVARDRTTHRLKVASSIMAVGSAALMLGAGFATAERRSDRESLEEAIVVADEVRPVNDKHIVLSDAPALAAGTRVRVADRVAGYAELRIRGERVWVPERTILALPRTL